MNATEFKQKFLPCQGQLYRTAYRLMGNAQDAEDMVQEAYIRLWEKRHELGGVQHVEAYCTTLMRNLCYDRLRLMRPEEESRPPEELPLKAANDTAHEVEQRDEAAHIRRLMEHLPEQQRMVMTMRDILGYSMEEIAEATALTAVNIRVLLSRARKRIREQFHLLTGVKGNKRR